MSLEALLLALVLLVAAYLALALWSRHRKASLGLQDGTVVAADDSNLHSPTLRSERLGLVGRPDHLLKVGNAYVPVEQKPSARKLYQSHIIQVGVLCMLVQEMYGVRPPYGVVVLAEGRQEKVEFTEGLEQRVLAVMAEMRGILATGRLPNAAGVDAKCRACGYRAACADMR